MISLDLKNHDKLRGRGILLALRDLFIYHDYRLLFQTRKSFVICAVGFINRAINSLKDGNDS